MPTEAAVGKPLHPRLAQPVALITGAGTGIGRATALALARAGYRTALVARRKQTLDDVALELGRLGLPEALAIPSDIATPQGAAHAVDACVAHFGQLDVLVCSAGVAPCVPLRQTSEADLDACFRTNALSPAWLTLRAWPSFESSARRSGVGGCVVYLSSMATIDPFEGFFAYAASKAGVNMLAASVAKEGRNVGVRAFAIAPGAVETPLLRSAFGTDVVPTDAALAPEDVAHLVLACVRGEHDALNGRTIPVLHAKAVGWYDSFRAEHPPLPAITPASP